MLNRCPNPECENGQIYDGEYCPGCERAIGRMCPTCQDGTVDFDPRPSDMAELAKLTAIELRKRGIWAHDAPGCIYVARFMCPAALGVSGCISLCTCDFDSLGPIGCADEIQRQEAKRAQEWAGDK